MITGVKLVGTTISNKSYLPVGKQDSFLSFSDYYMSDADAIIEYSARLCYNSNDKFGTNEAFIGGIIKSEHYDVLEHAAAVFQLTYNPDEYNQVIKTFFEIKNRHPYFLVEINEETNSIYWGGNLRVWSNYVWETYGHETFGMNYIYYCLFFISYGIFESIGPQISELSSTDADEFVRAQNDFAALRETGDAIVYQYQYEMVSSPAYEAETYLLGFNVLEHHVPESFRHATFLIRNVSRALTHQHVRHRLLSHSQISLRYVDYTKQGDDFIIPESIALNKEASLVMKDCLEKIMDSYQYLRGLKIKKEDARAILPNATVAHIVSSAFDAGWQHYIKLRAAKDAQDEIRGVANSIRELYNMIYGR